MDDGQTVSGTSILKIDIFVQKDCFQIAPNNVKEYLVWDAVAQS
jgi:hypothetical protein